MGNGASVESKVFYAARDNNVAELQRLLKHVASETPREGPRLVWSEVVNHVDERTKFTPLMAAVDVGALRAVEWLVCNGADPNVQSPTTGNTAMHQAAWTRDPKA